MTPQFLALVTSFFYAGCFLATRRGLVYSTPATAAYVALTVNSTILWTIVFAAGGVPAVPLLAILCFIVGGCLQLGTRMFAYHGVAASAEASPAPFRPPTRSSAPPWRSSS